MIEKQQKNRIFNPESSSLHLREPLIKRVKDLASQLKITHLSLYTCISFIDQVLGKWDIYKESSDMLALISLLLSTKFHETCDQSSKTRQLYDLCKTHFGEKNVIKYESLIANILEWEFDIQTPLHFLNFYLNRGVIFSSDLGVSRLPCAKLRPLFKSLRLQACKACFAALADYQFYQYTSLAVGACAVAVGRLEVGLRPLWPPEMKELSWVPWDSVEKCFKELVFTMGLGRKLSRFGGLSGARLRALDGYGSPRKRSGSVKRFRKVRFCEFFWGCLGCVFGLIF